MSYIVRDANDFPVAYVYFELEPGRRAAANLMTKDEVIKIAANIAKLPELLRARRYAVKVQFVRGGIRIRAGPAEKQGLLKQVWEILRDYTGSAAPTFSAGKTLGPPFVFPIVIRA